ncbi:MAG: putative stage sporulation protein, partial [Labilithrix sp.]|nr:putative stage sporulation protein [Labilithrix sp.]
MRWLVEVSSLGKTDTQKFCVDAESWQRALQAARAHRGEEGPMSGFSIELLEEGYRAVDPLARVRFVVKRAADDMPLTPPTERPKAAGAAKAGASGSVAPPAIAPHVPGVTGALSKSVPPPGDASSSSPLDLTKARRSAPPASLSTLSSSALTSAPAEPTLPNLAGGANAPASSSSSDGAGNVSSGGGKSVSAAPRPGAPTTTGSSRPPTMTFNAGPHAEPERPADRAEPPAIGSAIPGLPPTKLVSAREQNPNDASPLTYREYGFAVPEGTTEEQAADVLRAQLRYVEAHIATAKMGKLVNLAVFDVEFSGKPPRAPLATLTWKDWKGEPVVAFPARTGPASKPPRPPSQTPASLAASALARGTPDVVVPKAAPVPDVAP